MSATLLNLRPLNSHLHVRLLKEPEQTEGGIYLPDTLRDNWTSGEVIERGRGYLIPGTDFRSTIWAEPEDIVVFRQHSLRSIDNEQGMVREEDVIAYQTYGQGPLHPLNDWVEIELIARDEATQGGIIIPEDQRQRANLGRVMGWGPGYLRLNGPYYGSRKSVAGIIGVDSDQLLGRLVYWSDNAEAIEAGRGAVEALFVKAGDLLILKEE